MTLHSDGNYKYTTMLPPGKVLYFFTLNKLVVHATDHSKLTQKYTQTISNIEHYDEIKTYKIAKFHYLLQPQGKVLDENYKSKLKV